MRESARYAWWLLIFLFMLIILGNIAFFWTLFFQPGGKGLASSNQPLGVEFQVRYALAVERFGLGEETIRSALQSAFEGMEKAFSPYEAAVYRLIVQSAFSAGDPKETLRLLPDLPSERLTAVQRRWQAVRLRDALTRPIAPSQVPTVVDSLGALPSPLARELLEITLYQRAGAADKARALREALAQRAAWGAVLLGAVLGAGCFAGLAGIGILLWYLLARLPLPKRPAPNESPFAYDPLLWALVIFLLVLLNAPVIRETLRGVEASNALYLLAVLLPLMYLLSLRREPDALGQLRWFQGSVWKQVGVALMGYAAYVPFLAVLLCLTVLLAPALPSEQTNPISERVSENQGALGMAVDFRAGGGAGADYRRVRVSGCAVSGVLAAHGAGVAQRVRQWLPLRRDSPAVSGRDSADYRAGRDFGAGVCAHALVVAVHSHPRAQQRADRTYALECSGVKL
jgi:hypothetical protein